MAALPPVSRARAPASSLRRKYGSGHVGTVRVLQCHADRRPCLTCRAATNGIDHHQNVSTIRAEYAVDLFRRTGSEPHTVSEGPDASGQ